LSPLAKPGPCISPNIRATTHGTINQRLLAHANKILTGLVEIDHDREHYRDRSLTVASQQENVPNESYQQNGSKQENRSGHLEIRTSQFGLPSQEYCHATDTFW
jgi:hypothetical protein